MPAHPASALYDGGCELLAAAQTLTAAARRPGCGEAIPATLGCLVATLDELATASAVLAGHGPRARTSSARSAAVTMQALDRLREALAAARDASEGARAQAAAAADETAVEYG